MMREIRDSGKVVGLDRIAVMAALNMANELLQTKARDEALETSLGPRLKVLNDRVESVLGNQQLGFCLPHSYSNRRTRHDIPFQSAVSFYPASPAVFDTGLDTFRP